MCCSQVPLLGQPAWAHSHSCSRRSGELVSSPRGHTVMSVTGVHLNQAVQGGGRALQVQQPDNASVLARARLGSEPRAAGCAQTCSPTPTLATCWHAHRRLTQLACRVGVHLDQAVQGGGQQAGRGICARAGGHVQAGHRLLVAGRPVQQAVCPPAGPTRRPGCRPQLPAGRLRRAVRQHWQELLHGVRRLWACCAGGAEPLRLVSARQCRRQCPGRQVRLTCRQEGDILDGAAVLKRGGRLPTNTLQDRPQGTDAAAVMADGKWHWRLPGTRGGDAWQRCVWGAAPCQSACPTACRRDRSHLRQAASVSTGIRQPPPLMHTQRSSTHSCPAGAAGGSASTHMKLQTHRWRAAWQLRARGPGCARSPGAPAGGIPARRL